MTTLCVLHHRLLHAEVIGVEGKAPFDLEWKIPKLTETAMMRLERRRREIERKKKKAARKAGGDVEPEARNDSEAATDSSLHTCAQTPGQTFAEAEEGEESPRIDDDGGFDSLSGEDKEHLAPEPAPVGAAYG